MIGQVFIACNLLIAGFAIQSSDCDHDLQTIDLIERNGLLLIFENSDVLVMNMAWFCDEVESYSPDCAEQSDSIMTFRVYKRSVRLARKMMKSIFQGELSPSQVNDLVYSENKSDKANYHDEKESINEIEGS